MIKYFIRHYWRYLAMALAFTTISFLVNSCEVKAENEIYTVELNGNMSSTNKDNIIYQNNNGALNTGGRGTLIFTLSTIQRSTNTSFYVPTLKEVTINTQTDIYTCDIGTLSMVYNEEDNYKANVYTVVCEINIGSYGIRQIKANMQDSILNSYWINTSQYMTFIKNTDVGTQNILSAIQNMLNTYLGNINISDATTATNTGTTNAYLQSIQALISSNISTIIQQQQQAHQDAQAQKEATDNINDSINDSTVEDPDSDLEDMQENEISNTVISDLLLLPINMFENIIDAIGGTCSSFSLGALFGTTLVLPCIDIPSLIGNNLWSVIDVLFCGIFVLSIRKKFVDIFENITSLKDRGNELE